MKINNKKQSQFELFPGSSKNAQEPGRASRIIKDLTLSLENIIVLCIIFVMVVVLFFSFGVERGKKLAMAPDAKKNPGTIKVYKADLEPAQKIVPVVTQKPKEERVVFPVSVPEIIQQEESEPSFQPPLEKTDEQENLFTIQVASFKLEKNAQKEADTLKQKGHDNTFVVLKGSYSIVCVGKFGKRKEATKFSNKLKKYYNDCLVRRL